MSGRGLRFPNADAMPRAVRRAYDRTQAPAPKPRAAKPRRPSRDEEHNEQVVFINRIRALAERDKRFVAAVESTFAIPNGGGRSKREAGRLKAEGVKPGVSDLFVALPVAGHHGLWIEMKSMDGRPSREQSAWIASRIALGYEGAIARGADEALNVWLGYVERAFA